MESQQHFIHVTTPEAWDAAAAAGAYYPPGFEREGFIHCCHETQLRTVLADHFAGVASVLLLIVDPAKLTARVRYETAPNGDDYPHIYGAIDLQAVVERRSHEVA